MATIIWLPDPRADLERLYEVIEPHSRDAALRAVSTLLDAAGSLGDFPEQGQPWKEDPIFRELPVRFASRGYVIRYWLHEDQVIIVRVWHALESR